MLRQGPRGGRGALWREPMRRGGLAAFRIIAGIRERHTVATQSLWAATAMTAQSLRAGAICAAGLGLAGVLWFAFSGPFSLSELCTRNRQTWVFGLFDTPRYTAMTGPVFLASMASLTGLYLAALWLTPRVGG